MHRYLTEATTLTALLTQSIRSHYATLKHTIFYILCIAIIKNAAFYLADLTTNRFLSAVIFIVATLAAIYFFSAALLATHEVFCDQPKTAKDILFAIKERILKIYSSVILYVVGTVIVYYIIRLLLIVIGKIVHEPSAIHGGLLIIGWAIIFVYIAVFYFAMSLCVIKNITLKDAFHDSILQTERVKANVFLLYVILGAIVLLISPAMLHEYFLSTYYLTPLFDFIVLCVLGPIYINFMLLSMHDAQLQLGVEINN